MTIPVLVNGAFGRMGTTTTAAIKADSRFELVGQTGIDDNLETAITNSNAKVVIDFTLPDTVYNNCKTMFDCNVHPVIGTTGLSPEQIKQLQQLYIEKQLGGIIAPNFSIGAVLMMQTARKCAQFMPHVEIIEMHHDGKADAPSGTAIKTAEMIAETKAATLPKVKEKELIAGARGAKKNDIAIHSVRLPGLVAHQQVIFGGSGETLTIRHDTINREAFMPGVLLACEKVTRLKQLVYGLDHILFNQT